MAVAKQRGRRGNLLFVQRGALPGIGILTGRVLLQTAEETVSAGNDKGDHHAIAFLQILHLCAALDDFPHKLMAKNVAVLHLRDLSAIEMQIGAADRRGRDAQNDIVGLLDNGIGDILDANMVRTVIRKCFHATSERFQVSV